LHMAHCEYVATANSSRAKVAAMCLAFIFKKDNKA
jgi:hypothetical protein